MEKLLSIKEAAALLGLKVPTLYKKVCYKTIPYFKIGGRVLFRESTLEKWVNDHIVKALK